MTSEASMYFRSVETVFDKLGGRCNNPSGIIDVRRRQGLKKTLRNYMQTLLGDHRGGGKGIICVLLCIYISFYYFYFLFIRQKVLNNIFKLITTIR